MKNKECLEKIHVGDEIHVGVRRCKVLSVEEHPKTRFGSTRIVVTMVDLDTRRKITRTAHQL